MTDDTGPGRRARQAQQTRDEILQAARRLFAERGYARTTIREVADAAGVSPQTVYDSVGSKQALVARLNDLIDAEAAIGPIVAETMASGDPRRVVTTQARITRSILEHCGDIIHALVTGASAEPELEAVLAEGHRRHVAGARQVVGQLEREGALAPGLKRADAVDSLAALSDIRFALVLRETYGWSLDRIESWIARVSAELLLGPSS